jgi:hypothetical protein
MGNELTFGTEHITLPCPFMINIPPFFPSSISTAKCFLLDEILKVLTNPVGLLERHHALFANDIMYG